jgi:uncharacterized protein (DUF2141 family)
MRKLIVWVALATLSLYSCSTSGVAVKPAIQLENASTPGYIDVKVTGIPVVEGQLFVELYDAKSYFNYELVLNEKKVVVTGTSMVVRLEHVPAGCYMVVASQDANMNNKLDANFFGAPTEAYGFSREARAAFGIPKFEDGAIDFDGSSLSVDVKIKI